MAVSKSGRTRASAARGDRAARLIAAARRARRHSVSPFSGFAVGAALETKGGAIVTGCNIENATYGLTMCAERVALFKALSDGHRAFRRIAIVSGAASLTPPCGACRQLLWELAGDVEVILASPTRETARMRLERLLPLPFTSRLLAEAGRRQGEPRPARRRRGNSRRMH